MVKTKVWRQQDVAEAADADDDKRFNPRLPFVGNPVHARIGKDEMTLRLKDLSSGGAAGLLDAPVVVGDFLLVELDEEHVIEAEVRWIRRSMVGLRFSHTLDPIYVESVYARMQRANEANESDTSGGRASAGF